MKETISSFIKRNQLFLIFFVIALLIHWFLPLNWADDAVFMQKTANADIFTFLEGSARPFTDAATYIFIHNQWLWRILNPLILTVLVSAIIKIVPVTIDKVSAIFVCIFTIFPTMIMVDAGFIATTVNYLWAITFGIVNLLPLINTYYQRKTNICYLILLVPLLIYSTNMQQMCAVLLAVFIIANIYLAAKKSFKFYHFLQLIIVACGTVGSLYLNFNGDNSRMLRETNRYFPDFAKLNILEKTELGFSSTFFCMTMETRFAFVGFLAFTLFLSIMVFKRNKPNFLKILSLFPIVTAIIFGVYSLIPDYNSALIEFLKGGMIHYRMTEATYSFKLMPDIIFLIICFIMILCIWSLTENINHKLLAVFAFGLGLGSRMLMGFSPTVWASGYRTFCIMFITFIYIALIVLKQEKIKSE